MLTKNRFLIISAIALAVAAVSCTKEYSQEIAEGETLYITKSQAGENKLIDIAPRKASLSIDKYSEGQCDLLVSYEFLDGTRSIVFSFRIPDVEVLSDASRYILDGKAINGTCDFNSYSRDVHVDYEDVTVSGSIGFDGNAAVDISGLIGGRFFSINIQETSVKYHGSQFALKASVNYGESRGVSVTNKSASPCRVTFNLAIFPDQQNVLNLKSGESGRLFFSYRGFFWRDSCTGLVISYEGGSTTSVSGEDISKIEEGGSLGELKFIGSDTCWQLRTEQENSLFRSFGYPVYVYEITERR